MAVNAKRANNSPIPRDAIEGAAGVQDSGKFSIEVVNTQIYFKDKGIEPYNVVSNSLKREILSTDLEEGMSIKVETTNKNRKKLETLSNDQFTKE